MDCPITRGAPRRHIRNQRPSAHLNSAARGAPESWANIPSKRQDARRPQPHPTLPGPFSLTEGDLIIGTNWSAIGTLVERTTRFTMLLHLPPMPGHGQQPRAKNGPPLAGRGAEAVRDAIIEQLDGLPPLLRRSLTWDQGAELAQHAQLKLASDIDVWFCDPHSPWQRGTNENTNGLLRQYFPRGTDLARHSRDDLDAVALAINTRPRKTLGWRTPAEALEDLLRCPPEAGVATTA
jgi:IS30 family transposase